MLFSSRGYCNFFTLEKRAQIPGKKLDNNRRLGSGAVERVENDNFKKWIT